MVIKFTPYVEPKFTAYEPEKPVFTPLEKIEGEQMFTPYFEPYDMTPPQIRDMAKIMGVSAEPELEPQMGWEYVPAKVYSYLLEEPIAETAALVSLGLEKGFRLLGMDKLADTQAQVTEGYKAPPVSESVSKQTAYLRNQAYKQSPTTGTAFDISEAATRIGALLVQIKGLGKVPALKPTSVYKRFGTMATHGFVTTPGDFKDKTEAAVFRMAYSMTPFIAQHWGATGVKAIAIDSMLNTFLTTPYMIKAYNQAEETGNWTEFTSNMVTQTVMNVGMALTTTGYPAAHKANYLKAQAQKIGMPYNQLKSVVDSFDKAQYPKTEAEKVEIAKVEARMQELIAKDDYETKIETLAKDADKAPINKLISQNETKPIPDIQDKINKIALESPTDAQKAKVHILAKHKGLLTDKDKEKKVYSKYIESLVGEKSTKTMNQGQIQMVIENLDRMDIRTAKGLSRTPVKEITPRLLNMIKGIGEIGYKEKFRNPYEVFNKIGLLREVYLPAEAAEVALYDDLMQFRKEIFGLRKTRGINKQSSQRIFDAIENPKEIKVPKMGEKYKGKAWRGEAGLWEHGIDVSIKFKTAQEKIDYDAEKFGNVEMKEKLQNISKEMGIDLSKVSSKDVMWVAKNIEIAREYGEAREIKLPRDTIILMKDDEGGSLILKDSKKYIEAKIETDLNPAEKRAYEYGKKFFDDWANKLKLSPDKRIKNYVTHIFEKTMEDSLKYDKTIDPDIMRAFEFGAIPKTMFNPFLQERMGRAYGLKRDFWQSIQAYESQALKTYHYEPLLKKMNIYARFLPDLSHKYMSNYTKRMTNRPLDIDKGINNDIKEIMIAIEKSIKRVPGVKKLVPYLTTESQGNMAGRIAYYYTGILYETALGLRPISAIRNLGQGTLTIAETGLGNYLKGIEMLTTKAGRDILHKGVVYRSRKFAILPGMADYMPSKLRTMSQKTFMYMFRTADKFNVSSAFCSGYQEARSLGLSDKIAMERGDEVARKTQYMYTKMASPEFNQAATGKVLGVFTSWPRNYVELLNHWYRGDVSEVYKNYEKETGVKVYSEGWMSRHRAAITYTMMAALALYVEKKTRLRATQYIGFRTIETIPRFLAGQIAGLRLPLALSQVGVGVIGQNRQMLKQGLKDLNPANWFIILKELDDFDKGKKDWLDLLLYRGKPKFRIR